MGSTIVLLPQLSEEGVPAMESKLEDYKKHLEKSGATPYLIPFGGSNAIGGWGYIDAFQELMDQGLHCDYDDIVVAACSGGTLSDLAIANYLTGSKLRVHGVCVSDDSDFFLGYIDEQLKDFGIDVRASDIASVIDGYQGRGYGLNTDSELVELRDIMCSTGLSLDPCYTLKGVRGMLGEMNSNPTRFKGTRILYIHTGGIFGLYDGKINDTLTSASAASRVLDYREVIPD